MCHIPSISPLIHHAAVRLFWIYLGKKKKQKTAIWAIVCNKGFSPFWAGERKELSLFRSRVPPHVSRCEHALIVQQPVLHHPNVGAADVHCCHRVLLLPVRGQGRRRRRSGRGGHEWVVQAIVDESSEERSRGKASIIMRAQVHGILLRHCRGCGGGRRR